MSLCLPHVNGYWARGQTNFHQAFQYNRAANTCSETQVLSTPLQPTPSHTRLMLTLSGCKSTVGLTHIVLYSEESLSQNTRPDALLSLKFPQPKLPVKTLLGGEERE